MSFIKYFFPSKFRQKLQSAFNKINFIYTKAQQDNILWCNEPERQFIIRNFGDVTELPDFIDRFKRLINGLDEDSVATLIKVISYQKRIISSNEKEIDLFSENEKKQLKIINDEFEHEIIKLKDDIYAYKNYLLPINHFEKSVFYYKHGIDGLKHKEHVNNSSIIDVGGFIGDSALVFSSLHPRQIISFEPIPDNRTVFEKTIKLNDLSNVTIVNKALGDQDGKMTMNVLGSESSICNISSSTCDQKIEIEVTTLDNYVKINNITDVSMIKVDIEGAEQLFLEGAKQTICQQKPILLISIYHKADDFFNIKPLIESWNLGYSFKIHKPLFENATSEVLLIGEAS